MAGFLKKKRENHDSSKFKEPEYTPYVHLTWFKKLKSEGLDYCIPDGIKNKIEEATIYHIRNNKHHPEYWTDDVVGDFSVEKRDSPKNKLIDVTKMPLTYVSCMVADWLAVSDEYVSSPFDWADKNIGIRWNFSDSQKELIYFLINELYGHKNN